jgi:putative DNA methylase
MDAITDIATLSGPAPFSLKDAPALIERVFPAQKVGIEAQKERKAGAGQTLTSLGSYWKGRKPLILVRACVLASLLPATDDPQADLELFESLMRMDPEGISRREAKISAEQVALCNSVPQDAKARHLIREEVGEPIAAKWRRFEAASELSKAERADARHLYDQEREAIRQQTLAAMPFSQQVAICKRVEELEHLRDEADPMYADVLQRANACLGTHALTLPELVEQLGIARFGRRPIVGDPFCGGGSIPFEAARVGCDVVASDLNPVAAMLTWGALNIIGIDDAKRSEIATEQTRVVAAINEEIAQLGIEHNSNGDRAKAYLYCLETVDPRTGWRVPMAPSWVISRNRRCVAKLVPVHAEKRFGLVIVEGATPEDMAIAEVGTVRDGHLVYRVAIVLGGEEEEHRISISRLRGDGDGPLTHEGIRGNRLRQWAASDIAPQEPVWVPDAPSVLPGTPPGAWVGGDIWLERLYCIQWIDGADLKAGKFRFRTYFASPREEDNRREREVYALVQNNLSPWQQAGLIPDMKIELGEKTEEPVRTRGWTYWHHLFNPRHLLYGALVLKHSGSYGTVLVPRFLDRSSKLTRWNVGHAGSATSAPSADTTQNVFYNQAFDVQYNYSSRSFYGLQDFLSADDIPGAELSTKVTLGVNPASKLPGDASLWIFDPPYADAVYYHEITEYFIAWLRKLRCEPFIRWAWDSRRPLAIQGKGEKFRADMVEAFKAMANHMPDNGLQVCMFTHQDAGVWADMAQIVWGAGLRVTAAWYVSTETTSDLKKGGYVQGTVLLILRKRQGEEKAYKDELVLEVRGAVQRQVDLLTGLNQRAKARQRDENPFSDADVQMAGYAAALEVLTGYTHIEGVDMTREALRPRIKGQVGIVEEMIALAVQTATELMRPEGIDESLWERLVPAERFWLKMTEAESNRPAGQPAGKLDDYQNFAKAYRAEGWDDLMADSTPNRARLKGAADFKRAMMSGHPFAGGLVRPVLYAVNELRTSAEKQEDHATSSERAIGGLRDNLKSWAQQRQQAIVIADWLGRALMRHRPAEASAARTLAALIRTERLG